MSANNTDSRITFFTPQEITEAVQNLVKELKLEDDQAVSEENHDDSLKLFAKVFENVSFDAKTTASQFQEKAAQDAITAGDTPTLRHGTMRLYKKCDYKSDLRFFIYLFLKRSDHDVHGVIRRKCSAYGIDYRPRSTKGLDLKDLTIPRIGRAFSVDTATEILKMNYPGKITSKLFKQELPLVMQHAIFPGLIPVTKFTEDLKGIALILTMERFLMLGSPEEQEKKKNGTVEKLIESSAKYVDDAIHSGVYEDAAKFKVLTEAGVLNAKDNGEFELSARTAALMIELPAIRAIYSLTYSDAVRQLNTLAASLIYMFHSGALIGPKSLYPTQTSVRQ